MAKVIGIDLGTTYSAVAVLEGGKAEIIPNAEGSRTTPSVVAFAKDGELLVGEVAKRQAVVNPESTVYSIKRFMGRSFADVANEAARVPYRVERGDKGKPVIRIPNAGDKSFTPEELSSFILQKLKRDAEAHLGETVTQAVITVPAYFEDAQRQATKDAGRIAGLEVLRIVNEPTAASLAYGLEKKTGQTILVYDLGGGTFDVSVLEFGDGVFEVKSTSGNNHLGGDDIDEALMRWLAAGFQKEHGIELMKDRTAVQRLKEASEKAKKELSSVQKTNINIPYIGVGKAGPLHIDVDVTRATFEGIVRDLVEKTRGPVQQALKDANLGTDGLNEVIMVGGSTRIPLVQQLVKDLTGKEPNKTVNPDEAVAAGAAVQAGVITGDVTDLLLLDVTPLSLGIETLGGVFTRLIDRNTTIPAKKSKVFSTAADNQTSVDIKVYQGERQVAQHNKLLGDFHLDGIPPAPRGMPQVEVTFDIDANGIVNVTAKDLGTGKTQHITITGSTRLDDTEVTRMQEDAERFAEEDAKRVEEVNTRNEADALVATAERTLKENGDKVEAATKGEAEAALDALKAAITGGNLDEIKETTTALGDAIQKVGSEIYQKAAADAAAAAQAGAEGGAGPAPDVDPDAAGGPGGPGWEEGEPAAESSKGKKKETRTKKGEGPDSIDVDYEVEK